MEKDNINPAHYRQQPHECIEFTVYFVGQYYRTLFS